MSREHDLFEPTLQDHPGIAGEVREKPWRLGSQLWVAFFGGTLAITAIAYLNSQRLRMPRAQSLAILWVGLATSLLSAAALGWWLAGHGSAVDAEDRTLGRFAGRAVALVLYAVAYRIQRDANTLYQFNRQSSDAESYASLWLPGVVACVAGGSLQFLLALAVAAWR